MFVRPTHDQVPDPQCGGYLPKEGRHVEDGPYWWRRVADGDVVEADPPAAELLAPTPESPLNAGSPASDAAIPQTRTARKGAQA